MRRWRKRLLTLQTVRIAVCAWSAGVHGVMEEILRSRRKRGGRRPGESPAVVKGLPLKKQIAFGAVLSVQLRHLPGFWGTGFLRRYGLLFVLLPFATAVLIAVWEVSIWKLHGKREIAQPKGTKEANEGTAYRWEIPEETEESEPEEQNGGDETDFQTVLLAGAPEQSQLHGCRRSPQEEDIPIAYFPFVIGKHEELVDYVLNRSTVSRLHMRIDRRETNTE